MKIGPFLMFFILENEILLYNLHEKHRDFIKEKMKKIARKNNEIVIGKALFSESNEKIG